MSVKVEELMSRSVVSAQPHQSVDHVRAMLAKNHVSAVPVVDTDGAPVGIVSTTDFQPGVNGGSPIRSVMTEKVYTVPRYDDVHIAARIMRNHRIHRVVVTDEKRVVGILSAFDLLKLVEDHRYVMKNPPTPKKKRGIQSM